jgi:dUTPase
MQTLEFLLKPNAKLPTADTNSTSIELYAYIIKNGETTVEMILPGSTILLDLGVATRIGTAFIGLLFNTPTQKSLSVNFTENFSVITSYDRDFLSVNITNNGTGPYTIFHNQHIANLVIVPSFIPSIQRTNI